MQLANELPGGERQHYAQLDALRGIAALVVVIYHCLLCMPVYYQFVFGAQKPHPRGLFETLMVWSPLRIIWSGSSMVMLFFALSGFVLVQPWLGGRRQSYGTFLIRRVTRIYIPYLVAVALSAMLMVLAGRESLPVSAWFNMSWEKNVTLLTVMDHVFMTGRSNWIDGPVWSLVWEMRISVIFPLLLVLPLRYRMRGILVDLAVILAVYFSPHLIHASDHLADPVRAGAAYALLFLAGAVLAMNVGIVSTLTSRTSLILAASGVLILCTMPTSNILVTNSIWGFGAILIIAASFPSGPVKTFEHHPVCQWLGRISYSLYLIHVPIILTIIRLTYGRLPTPVALLIAFVISICLAPVFHAVVEMPCQQLGRRLTRKTL